MVRESQRESLAHIPYRREELVRQGSPRRYRGRALDQLTFPLGGIGTGSVSLGGWGMVRQQRLAGRWRVAVEVRGGRLSLETLHLGLTLAAVQVSLAGHGVPVAVTPSADGTVLHFVAPVTIKVGQALVGEGQ